MCHGITWFHVLCGHADPSLSTLILCRETLLTGDRCPPCIDLAWFPLKGLCHFCREEERKHRRRQIALTAYEAINEQRAQEWDSLDMLAAEHHAQTHDHHTDRRYDDWFEGQDMVEYQPQASRLSMPDAPSKNEMIENWLNHPDFLIPEVPESSNTKYSSPERPGSTTVKTQRSFIAVPARKHTGLMHQRKIQRSQIPVPVNRAKKQQEHELLNELEVIDETGSIDGMELFDRITF